MKEEWKDVKGYEGFYQVSNLGMVKSLERKSKHVARNTHAVTDRILPEKILKRKQRPSGVFALQTCRC